MQSTHEFDFDFDFDFDELPKRYTAKCYLINSNRHT